MSSVQMVVEPVAVTSSTDWEAAARTFQRRVLVSVLALGVRVDRAEEIVQATWSTLIEAERAGRLARIELPGLALTQARFLALHELRRSGVEQRLLVSADEIELRPDFRRGPEADLLVKEQTQRTLRAIEQLPESTQRVFRLLYGEPPLEYVAVAEQLSLSLQRVRQIACELRAHVRTVVLTETP